MGAGTASSLTLELSTAGKGLQHLPHCLKASGGGRLGIQLKEWPSFTCRDIFSGREGAVMLLGFGYTDDMRLKPALELLKRTRLKDGRWILDATHPDLGQGAEYRLRRKPKRFILEKVGQPSKMITLIAMKVLKRVEGDLPR